MYEAPVASYLIPTERSQLCTGPDCCQEDDYASPHRVMMLNSSRSVSGNRTYTTFFMSLTRTQCVEEVDNVGCCNANISTIWIDVGERLGRACGRAVLTGWAKGRKSASRGRACKLERR